MITITVRYSCALCMLRDASVAVPARMTLDEDVVAWMHKTTELLSADHHQRSPTCEPRTLTNVKIPTEGAEWIGGPVIQ